MKFIIFYLLVGICDCVIMEQAIQFERNKIKITFYSEYALTITEFDVKQYDPEYTFVIDKTTITKRYFDKTLTKFKTEQSSFKIANVKLTYSFTEKLFWCLSAGISVTELTIAKNRISTLSPGYELSTGLRGLIFPYTDFYPSLVWNISCRYTNHRLEELRIPEGTRPISNIFETLRIGICLQSTIPIKRVNPYVGLMVFRQFNSLIVKEKDRFGYVEGVQDRVNLILGSNFLKFGVVEFSFLSDLSCSIGLRIPF